MTPITTTVPTDHAVQHERSYVDWGTIFAGTVVATSISLVLSGFGSAIGLSLASPFAGKGLSGTAIAVAAGLWVIWVAVTSLIAGSYVTGRLRRRAGDASADEVSIRDGVHGLVVWALSALIGAMIATMSLAGLAKTGASIIGTGAPTVASVTTNAAEYVIDSLARNDTQVTVLDEGTRQQIGRILTRSVADGQMTAQDRTYLTRLVGSKAGVEPAEIERRIDAFSAQAKQAADRARSAAEAARRMGILLAFLTAASLAVAAAGAWWGASMGGKHRDDNTAISPLTHW
jgi:hypothetical protein